MTNLVLHITVPKGLTLSDGRYLHQDLTYDLVSKIDPYYCSIDQVRLAGGQLLRKLSDITIASQIYQSSQEANLITPTQYMNALVNDVQLNSVTAQRVIGSRNQWVTAAAARDLILGQTSLLGGNTSHVLANFSVERTRGFQTEGIPARLKELDDSIKFYEVVIRSNGTTMPGGRPRSGMAAKGVYDYGERTPGRTWVEGTGLGANMITLDYGSPTGGRGKVFRTFMNPILSSPLISMRFGTFNQGMGLPIRWMFPQSVLSFPLSV